MGGPAGNGAEAVTARLTIVGLGPGDQRFLTLEAIGALRSHERILLRTGHLEVVSWLRSPQGESAAGLHAWESFDDLIAGAAEGADAQIADAIERRLAVDEAVCYAAPGDPLTDDRPARLAIRRAVAAGLEWRVVGGLSLGGAALSAVRAATERAGRPAPDLADAAQIVDAARLDDSLTQPGFPHPEAPLLVVHLGDEPTRRRALAWLAARFPSDHVAHVVTNHAPSGQIAAHGQPAFAVGRVPLRELEAEAAASQLLAVFVAPAPILSVTQSLRTLEYVTRRLRAPDGCPWDREQTHDSIKRNLLEETYELLEGIEERDPAKGREELGDLLMQVFLHAEMGREAGEYDLGTVTRGIVEKLIRRHPHVFAGIEVDGVAGVLRNWDAIKKAEGKHERSILAGIPAAMPALAYAQGAQERAARTGFAWPDASGAWAKLDEELSELRAAATPDQIAIELGDVLFVLAGLANYLGVQAEEVLREANRRFRARFDAVEAIARERDVALRELPLGDLLALWADAKARAGL